MARASTDLTVQELQRLLEGKKTQLDSLVKRKEKLVKELAAVDGRIESLQGKLGPQRGRPKGSTNKKAVQRRPKNDRTLRDIVEEVLTQNKKGLALGDISKRVFESGYRSSSTNFHNVLYQCLYNHKGIAHDGDSGLYFMK